MGGVSRVAHQHQVVVVPGRAADGPKVRPLGVVAEQPPPLEMRSEDLLEVLQAVEVALARRLGRPVRLLEAGPAPALVVHLDDEGAQVLLVGIDVGAEAAVLVLLEEEGEGRVAERGAVPGEDRAAHLDGGLENLFPAGPEDAVDAVRGSHQVVRLDDLVRVQERGLEEELDALRRRPPLQDVEQALAGDRPEADAAAAQHLAVDADLDRVPGVRAGQDLLVGGLVVLTQVAHRLLGEDDAEPEGVVRPVPLVDGDLVARVGALGEHREVQSRGAAPRNRDLHLRRKRIEGRELALPAPLANRSLSLLRQAHQQARFWSRSM